MKPFTHALGVAAIAILCSAAASDQPAPLDKVYSQTYNDCMTQAAGSTMPMEDCISAEHDDWDKQLNQTYQALMASRSAAGKDELRAGERAWLKREKAKCDQAGGDEAGGSLQQVEIDQCYLDQIIWRTLYLRSLK